jgi:hypothetical protein
LDAFNTKSTSAGQRLPMAFPGKAETVPDIRKIEASLHLLKMTGLQALP